MGTDQIRQKTYQIRNNVHKKEWFRYIFYKNRKREKCTIKIRVSKDGFRFIDWQIAQIRVYFVPLYENKKI